MFSESLNHGVGYLSRSSDDREGNHCVLHGGGLIAGGGSKSGHGSHTFLINKTSLTQFAPTAPGWREKLTGQENIYVVTISRRKEIVGHYQHTLIHTTVSNVFNFKRLLYCCLLQLTSTLL